MGTMIAELSLALSASRVDPKTKDEAKIWTTQVVEEEALEHLLNLSPIEVKTLLFYVLSGKEFGLSVQSTRRHSLTSMETVSIMAPVRSKRSQASDMSRQFSCQNGKYGRRRSHPP